MNDGNATVKKGIDQGWATIIAALITGIAALWGIWYQQQSQHRETRTNSNSQISSEADPATRIQRNQTETAVGRQYAARPTERQSTFGTEETKPPQVYRPNGGPYESTYSGGSRSSLMELAKAQSRQTAVDSAPTKPGKP